MDHNILVVEDEKGIREAIQIYLKNQGYRVFLAENGQEGLNIIKRETINLAVVDIMMPVMDGITMTMEVRKDYDFPIIFLSAKSEDIDKITGLNIGADDYITKPFNILEVKARIKAIMRRTAKRKEEPAGSPVLVKGNMKIDCEGRRVFIGEREINLTAKEFDVLELLAMNPNKVYSRENLLNLIWGYDYPGDARTVDVHIRRLREKIEQNPSEPKYVHTKWGVGYYFQG